MSFQSDSKPGHSRYVKTLEAHFDPITGQAPKPEPISGPPEAAIDVPRPAGALALDGRPDRDRWRGRSMEGFHWEAGQAPARRL